MTEQDYRIDRRLTLKWMFAAAATSLVHSEDVVSGTPLGNTGYGLDPDLQRVYKPGDLWPLTFSDEQRRVAAALCQVLIPADKQSPGAGGIHVHDFIDEWISAPYPTQAKDRGIILSGLAILAQGSLKRFSQSFDEVSDEKKTALCDDMAIAAKNGSQESSEGFFTRFKALTVVGYYTTPEGMKAIGYTGNLRSVTFDGPPAAALSRLGLD
jgi:hypothetical protein